MPRRSSSWAERRRPRLGARGHARENTGEDKTAREKVREGERQVQQLFPEWGKTEREGTGERHVIHRGRLVLCNAPSSSENSRMHFN